MTEAEVVERVVSATRSQVPLEMTYQGTRRQVCIHMVGVTADNRVVMHGFQFGGSSSRGPVTPATGSWKFLYLDEATAMGYCSEPVWYPDLQKSETGYQAPAFVKNVLAVAGGHDAQT